MKYEKANVEIVRFENEDIVTGSCTNFISEPYDHNKEKGCQGLFKNNCRTNSFDGGCWFWGGVTSLNDYE